MRVTLPAALRYRVIFLHDTTGGVTSLVMNNTVTLLVLPPSSAASITIFVELAPEIIVPAAGVWVLEIDPGAVQLSVTSSAERKSGTVAWHNALRFCVTFPGVVITGGTASITVRLIVAVCILPARSLAVIVITVIPVPTKVPATGACVTTMLPVAVQLSETVTAITGTGAWHPAPALTIGGAGKVITGLTLSLTVTVKEQVVILPLPSVTRKVFVVVPTGKVEPLASPAVRTVVLPEQLSVPTGVK